MKYALGNMLNGAGGLNADQLALDLQFAADKTLTARRGPTPVLTRGSAATQVGATGLIEYAPENLFFPSELLTNSPTAVVLNRVTGDSVFSNPVFISETTSGTLHRVFTNVAVASAGVNSIGQFFFKQNGRQFIYFNGSNGAPSNTFDLSTGVFTNATGWTSQSLGEGWWKITTPVFQPSSNNPFWAFQLNITNAVADSNYTGDTTKGVLFAGTQLERFSTDRVYNPTTTAAFYGPRFDHDPVTLACRGLLIEEGRTNLLLHSANFKNTTSSNYWENLSATTVTVDQIASPDGAVTADLLTTSTTAFDCFARRAINWVGSTQYSYSIFLKRGPSNHRYVGLYIGAGITGLQFPYFDFDNPTTVRIPSGTMVGTINSTRVDAYPNGWYRVSVTFTTAATPVTPYGGVYVATSNGTLPSTPTAGLDCYIWGIQAETGAFPTSYIPTTTSALARSADTCNITGANFTSFWNRFAGTCIVGVGSSLGSAPRFVSNNSAARALEIYGTTNIDFFEAGGSQEIRIVSSPFSYPIKLGLAYSINDYQSSYNGLLGGSNTNTGGTIPDATALHIGNLGGTSNRLTGHIQFIRYYKKRPPNAKLVTLTA